MKRTLRAFLLFALVTVSVLSGGCGKSQEDIDKEYVKELRTTAVKGSGLARSDARYELASLYFHGERHLDKNPAAAVHWLRRQAEDGDAFSQFEIGTAYYYGNGIGKNEKEGLYWISQAAQRGNSNAKNLLNSVSRNEIPTVSSNPFNWGYRFSSAFWGDIADSYGTWILIGIIMILTGVASPIGLGIIIYVLYQI